jgi:hypothetical protein
MDLEKWWKAQYVRELQMRSSHPTGRLAMINGWRLGRDISIWTTLPGESPPKAWKPTDADAAWERCDKTKAQELHAQWTHVCMDPYYCPMHGIGSD